MHPASSSPTLNPAPKVKVKRWVTIEDALQANREVMAGGVGVMRWLVRETRVLELLLS
ncbi:hypothetical protein [Kribbella sp. CA-294648]|uniref:hypothetical protein n=1 Tax=Kribbella sp. CA-294648 TaxID=3239948 RepID=UPI003D89CE69